MYPSRSRTSQLLTLRRHIALAVTGAVTIVALPDTALLIGQTWLVVLASCGPYSGRRLKVIAPAADFKSAIANLISPHRPAGVVRLSVLRGKALVPGGFVKLPGEGLPRLAWLRSLGAND